MIHWMAFDKAHIMSNLSGTGEDWSFNFLVAIALE